MHELATDFRQALSATTTPLWLRGCSAASSVQTRCSTIMGIVSRFMTIIKGYEAGVMTFVQATSKSLD